MREVGEEDLEQHGRELWRRKCQRSDPSHRGYKQGSSHMTEEDGNVALKPYAPIGMKKNDEGKGDFCTLSIEQGTPWHFARVNKSSLPFVLMRFLIHSLSLSGLTDIFPCGPGLASAGMSLFWIYWS